MAERAYDYSSYERRRTAAAPVVAAPEKAAPRLTVKKGLKKRRVLMFRAAVLLTVTMTFAGMFLYNNMLLTEIGDQISTSNENYKMLQSENVRLNNELESDISVKNLQDDASSLLGLGKVRRSQIEYIRVDSSDVVTVANPAGFNLFDKIRSLVSAVSEYFSHA